MLPSESAYETFIVPNSKMLSIETLISEESLVAIDSISILTLIVRERDSTFPNNCETDLNLIVAKTISSPVAKKF